MPAAAIQTEHLTRRYGARRGVENVSLSIPEGSLYGFLGPNGAGKTTTIRVLLGFLRATSGSAHILGHDCWRRGHTVRAQVGAIPGDLRLWPWFTGLSALRLFGRIRGLNLLSRGRQLADELELDLSVRVRAMSRGTRQKLGLILALAHDPRILILDEPTTGLDPLIQDRLRAILKRLTSAGHTVFFSSHTLAEVEAICDRVAIVRQGRIVADSTLADLQRQAGHEVTIAFKPGAPLPAPPDFLKIDESSPRYWKGRICGEVAPLLSFLAAAPVDDVTISRPDLEALFRRFYESPEQGA